MTCQQKNKNTIKITFILCNERRIKMSNIENGRGLVQRFVEVNKVSIQDLASTYGKSRIWVQRALNGSDRGPAVNNFILEIIRDFKIR